MSRAAAKAQIDGLGEVEEHCDEALCLDVSRLHALDKLVGERRGVDHGSVAAGLFGGIERFIASAQKRACCFAVRWVARDPKADRDRDRVTDERFA